MAVPARPEPDPGRGPANAAAAESAATAAFLERLRHAAPAEEFPAAPSVPGVTILEQVGRGGMGVVYRGQDAATGRDVAVKVLWRAGQAAAAAPARARREGAILARLDHPNIVRVLSSGVCGAPHDDAADDAAAATESDARRVPYIVMEWLSGGTAERFSGGDRLGPREAARLIRDVALAVAEVHSLGVVHRDIKPANILLGEPPRPGDPPVPKLADFGLARDRQASSCRTLGGELLGTPGYLSPEQAGLDPALGTVGPATDVHGLGATLHFLLTGRPPHEGRSFVESLARAIQGTVDWSAPPLAALPTDLRTILGRCLERIPADRYATARDLAEDLTAFLEHRPIRARRRSPAERAAGWARRHPARAAVGGLLLVALVAVAIGAVAGSRRLASAGRATAASRRLARDLAARLADERMERLLSRGNVLDEHGREFLREARTTYLEWPLEDDVRESLLFRARGARSVARVLARLGQIDDAAGCFAASRGPFAELADRGLADAGTRAAELEGLLEEYFFLVESGRPAAAEPLIARALALVAQPLDPPPLPSLRGTILVDQGMMLSALGRHDAAAAALTAALAHLRETVTSRPDDADAAECEHSALFNAAICSGNAGRHEEQIDRLRTLLDRTAEAATRLPDHGGRFRHPRLQGLGMLAAVTLAAGRPEESLAASGRLAAETRAGLAEEPADAFLRGKLVEAAVSGSRAATILGRPEEASAALAEAVAIAEEFVAAEPAVFFHVQRLMTTLREQAAHEVALDRPAEAIAAWRRIRTAVEPWQDMDAALGHAKPWMALAYGEEARLAFRGGDPAGAVALLEKAVAIAGPPQRGPLFLALADAAVAAGDPERARRAAEQAIAALEDPGTLAAARALLDRLDRLDR